MDWRMRLIRGGVAAILGVAAGVYPVWAQRLIAVTEARNVLGEPTRLLARSLDAGTGMVLPGGHVLPGTALTGAPVAHGGSGAIFFSSGSAWDGGPFEPRHRESALTSFRTAPFDTYPDADDRGTPGWREYAVGVVRDDRTMSHVLVTAAMNGDEDGALHGWLQSRPWPPTGTPGRVAAAGGVTPLSIAPRFTVGGAGSSMLVFGASAQDGPVLVQQADPAAGTAWDAQGFTAGTHPDGLGNLAGVYLSPDRTTVWILFSSLSGESPSSWLYAMDAQTQTIHGPPLVLSGVARSGATSLTGDLQGNCWVATQEPGTDFGHVRRVELAAEENGLQPVLQQSVALVGVGRLLSIQAHPVRGDLLVAIDRMLEYWPGGERGTHRANYDAPVAVMLWTESGPVIGEGNRIHRISLPDAGSASTVSIPSGWILNAYELPAAWLPANDGDGDGLDDNAERRMQTRRDDPDTDGDGIPDGSDPHPNAPSPRLVASAEVVFPYTAVGRQLRALQIESRGAPDAQWRITYDTKALPWLRVHPLVSRGSGYAYMGVDPEQFDPAGVVSGTLEVALTGKPQGNRPGFSAAYSPATVHVRVEPPRDPVRTILWLWPADSSGSGFRSRADPQGLNAFGNLASGYPFYFSTVEHFGPASIPLEEYSLVVVTARAAGEGALTQLALTEYLSGGGAVLFLGEHLEGGHYRDLGSWLEPIGIQVDMSKAVHGAFEHAGPDELLRHWPATPMKEGCVFDTKTPADSTVVDRDGGQVFVAKSHGYGRIALIAAPDPLESEALEGNVNRAFATDLLYWLGRAGYAVEDLDGDGLLDGVEDRNNNSATDEGETAWLNPDTDGDGIPDGLEDANRNGQVDAGETDPRKADSDGDGTLDGADGSPLG